MTKGRHGRFSDTQATTRSERRAGLETGDAEAGPITEAGKAASGREAGDASTDRFRRGNGGGMCGRGEWTQHGKP